MKYGSPSLGERTLKCAVLFIIVKTGKQPKCPSRNVWIKMMCMCIYLSIYIWMDKDDVYMYLYMYVCDTHTSYI